ncbi:MAG: hypothetical protein DRI81_05240 [Chloroflexi bacterium]|nr:MAG: hypothetical protein DRI81_05240 [Chloroflexota bacterium]
MTIHFLLAPARAGKTAHAVARIRELPPLAPVRVLVSGQMQAVAFRRRLARAGGALGVEVQTFYDLYADVLALAGDANPLPRLPAPVRRRLIRRLTTQLCDAGQLSYYAPLRGSPGFSRLLVGLFEELERGRVFPRDLVAATAGQEPRLAELAHLYAAYQTWLGDNNWTDAEGQGWLAARVLENDPALLSDLALLIVDGLDEFNPTQLAVLRLLADRAAEIIITLTGDPDRPNWVAHRRFARARAALSQTLDTSRRGNREASKQGDLAHLEANLFEPDVAPLPANGAVEFLEAQNRAAEAREALRWLKARIVREGAALSDVAVIARDVTPYRPFLEEIGAEFGMPLRFASGAPLRANPAIAALLNLLALPLPAVDWSPRALLDALTSPYFDWGDCGLLPGDADRLGDAARTGQVVSGPDQWREAFQRLSDRAAEEPETPGQSDEGLTRRHPPTGKEAARLEAVFEEIVAQITPPPTATLRERVAWVEELIGDDPSLALQGATQRNLRLRRSASHLRIAERDVAALHAFKDILRNLVLDESAVGQGLVGRGSILPHLPYGTFVAELIQAVDEATCQTPAEGDAVLVASAMEARGLGFDSVALLGLAEGDFPRAEREDVLLREADRDWLAERGIPIEPGLRGDEATFFYQAVTRARRRLLLCRPYLADDGQEWEASPYWAAALALFDDPPVRHVRPTDPVADAASEQELTLYSNAQPATAQPAIPRGDLSTLTARLAERFGPDQPWSSSRLETYAKCPLHFWATYAMRLEPRELPQVGFDVLALGSIYHLILEKLYDRAPDGDPERLRAALPKVAQEVYDSAPNDYGFRPTPLWERQQEELTETLRRTLEALIEVAGEYKPTAPELAFGLKEEPPLVLEGGQFLKLRGYIDRVDRAPDGRLRIIDYKAGSTPISARDLTDGYRLQLPLYALAAEQALGAQVASGFYWHINSAKPSSLKLEKYEGGVAGAIETAVEHTMEIVAAVRAGKFAPTPPDGGCPSFCPAVPFCDQYKPKAW